MQEISGLRYCAGNAYDNGFCRIRATFSVMGVPTCLRGSCATAYRLKWETPEQWEARAGERLPRNVQVAYRKRAGKPWKTGSYGTVAARKDVSIVIISPEWGMPPANIDLIES
jgi:hypothetical protein